MGFNNIEHNVRHALKLFTFIVIKFNQFDADLSEY